jgi:uncharacterized protein YqgC (DUF456 family)
MCLEAARFSLPQETSRMAYALLVLAQVVGLALIPLGLPGIWLQVGGLAAYGFFTDFTSVGWVPLVVITAMAVLAEMIEFSLGGRFARKYGGGRRAAWGAILGGIAGAIVGVPVPIIGSLIGAFLGSFLGAAILEFTSRRKLPGSLRAGWGALLGRLAATAVKSGLGVAVAALALLTAWS